MADGWPSTLAGFAIEHHASVGSTQDVARTLAAAGEPRRIVVVADVQTGGHGRQGRRWASPAGNLYSSIVIPRGFAEALAPAFSLIAAVAVAQTLATPAVTLKWPNDVLLGGRKVVGLLLEAHDERLIIGFGANVASTPIPEATSLQAAGITLSPQSLLEGVLVRLDEGARDLEDGNFASWRAQWLARAAWLGEPVQVQVADRLIAGINRGIDEHGALLVETPNGLATIMAGDVERVRPGDKT